MSTSGGGSAWTATAREFFARMTRDSVDQSRLACPDQSERDPSGRLAELTLAAVADSRNRPPAVTYLCSCRSRELLAAAGRTAHGPLLSWWADTYLPRDHPDAADAPAQAGPHGVTWADGGFALLVEPPGYRPPPASFRLRCRACAGDHNLDRAAVIAELRHTPPRRIVRLQSHSAQ